MSGSYTDNKAAQVAFTASLSILVVTDLIGNTLVILVILTNKSMKSPMNSLLVNLAVADIMVGLFIAPQYVFIQLFIHPVGTAGIMTCKLLTGGNLTWVGSAASAISLVAISFERYFAVIYPHSTKYKLTIKKVKKVVAGSWLFAVVLNVPLFIIVTYRQKTGLCGEEWPVQQKWIGSTYGILWFISAGVLPITIMTGLYSRVIYNLWFKRSKTQPQATQLAVLKSRKRLTKMIFTVSVIYGLCWFPDLTMYLLHLYNLKYNYNGIPLMCGVVLVTCNSAINPFIYTFQSEKFRRHLKEFIFCRKRRRNRVSDAVIGIFFDKTQPSN